MTYAPPAPPVNADAETLTTARQTCAARARERGEHELAASFEQGSQDAGWAMRHEVARLRAELRGGVIAFGEHVPPAADAMLAEREKGNG